MAHKITAVAKPQAGQSSAVDVPQEVKDEIDALYNYLRENPNEEGYGEFDDEKEKLTWLRQARTYASTREAGALKFRQLPSKHLKPTQVRFSLTADLPGNGEREGNS